MINTPRTQEEYSAKVPALQVLMAMGYSYLTPAACLALRGSERELILHEVLIDYLGGYRFTLRGREHALSANAIEQVVREISTPAMNEGLLSANQKIYDQLLLGITVTEFVEGRRESITVPLIDWSPPPPARHRLFRQRHSAGDHRGQAPRQPQPQQGHAQRRHLAADPQPECG